MIIVLNYYEWILTDWRCQMIDLPNNSVIQIHLPFKNNFSCESWLILPLVKYVHHLTVYIVNKFPPFDCLSQLCIFYKLCVSEIEIRAPPSESGRFHILTTLTSDPFEFDFLSSSQILQARISPWVLEKWPLKVLDYLRRCKLLREAIFHLFLC